MCLNRWMPVEFRRVLIERTRSAFPSLNALFVNYSNIIDGLAVRPRSDAVLVPEVALGPAKKSPVWVTHPPSSTKEGVGCALQDPPMRSSLPSEVYCKFCGVRGHATRTCHTFPTHMSR
jgi:hypothetical protein